MRYLIDTDWAIGYLRDIVPVADRVDALRHDGIALSIISLAELYEGRYVTRDPEGSERRLQAFLAGVTVLPLDDETCRVFGRERGRLRAAGMLISDMDLLIAATAAHHDLTVLTNNRTHFERIEGINVISV